MVIDFWMAVTHFNASTTACSACIKMSEVVITKSELILPNASSSKLIPTSPESLIFSSKSQETESRSDPVNGLPSGEPKIDEVMIIPEYPNEFVRKDIDE